MPLAIVLGVDAVAGRTIAGLTRRLAAAGFAPPTIAPHVTLVVLPEDSAAPRVLAVAASLAGWTPIGVSLASLGVFTRPGRVLFLAPVVSADLLARQAMVLALLPGERILPHQAPGVWVPHVTLAEDLDDPATAVAALGDPVLPLAATLDRLAVIRLPPAQALAAYSLHS